MTVAIVGGSSGVGLELTRLLLEGQERVLVLDRKSPPPSTRLAEFVELDLMDPDRVSQVARSLPGSLTAVALVAGIADRERPGDILRANYLGHRALVGEVLATGTAPTLAVVSSISASTAGVDARTLGDLLSRPESTRWMPHVAMISAWDEYRLSKWLIKSWALKLAADLVKQRARVNVISPGAIETRMLDSLRAIAPSRMLERGVAAVSRNASPLEVARVIEFLIGSSSSWVNGVDIRVDGGLMNAYNHRSNAQLWTNRRAD